MLGVGKDIKQPKLSFNAGKSVIDTTTLENPQAISVILKVNIHMLYDLVITFFGIYLTEMHT